MLSLLPVAPVIVAEMDPVPVITGMIALFMLIGLAVFVRIKKRWADFRQVAENHGFTVAAQRPSFARHWRTLATQSEGAWTLEIREEQVPRDENEDYFQELTLRLPAAGGLEFLFRPKSHWRKLEPEGDARYVQTGDAEFDGAWLMETNQPALLRTALDSELRAHFAGLQQTPGIQRLSLKDGLLTLRDNRSFLPADRFAHALKLIRGLATVAEVWARKS